MSSLLGAIMPSLGENMDEAFGKLIAKTKRGIEGAVADIKEAALEALQNKAKAVTAQITAGVGDIRNAVEDAGGGELGSFPQSHHLMCFY